MPLAEDAANEIENKIKELNAKGHLHMQLIQNEPRAFQCMLAKYGKFRNVSNYIVMAGKKTAGLDERIGYYGEQLVLSAQMAGLNTCWVGQSYYFEYMNVDGVSPAKVRAVNKFSLVGFTKMDLGIAKCHFEIGAGKENFTWAE